MVSVSKIALSPLAAMYGAVTRGRLALYRTGLLPTRRVSVPVISVGNITTGGTGKTPLVEWLARHMASGDELVCILTRGYGRDDKNWQVVVSDGETVRADAFEGGDEPRLLAESLLGESAVISNANRFAAANWAIANLRSTLFILDDGFQHLALARDFDLVAIDSTNPWGNGFLLPLGRLREPTKGLSRADAVVLTRANLVPDLGPLVNEIEILSKGKPVFFSRSQTVRVRRHKEFFEEDESDAEDLPREALAAFCALGNPDAFFAHVRADGHNLVYSERFRDHHIYSQSDIDALCKDARAHGAECLVTTAKDAVKLRALRFELPCYVIEIEQLIDDESTLLMLIYDAIDTSRAMLRFF